MYQNTIIALVINTFVKADKKPWVTYIWIKFQKENNKIEGNINVVIVHKKKIR